MRVLTKKLISSRNLWNGLALFSVYWIVAFFLDFETLSVVVNAVAMVIALGVVALYSPLAVEAMAARQMGRELQLALGICLGWAAVAQQGAWTFLWRIQGLDPSRYAGDYVTFIRYQALIAAILHLTAPADLSAVVPRKNYYMAAIIAAALSAIGVAFALGLSIR